MHPILEGMCPLLQVFDTPRSLRFYRDVLGFEVVRSAPPPETNATGVTYGWDQRS
jgi:catechol 2,3-dioxygenase-like lactoylglutathione lyase family enzyme